MKYTLPFLIALSACGAGPTQPVWLKPGTPALTAEQDYLSCAAKARRDFPADRRIDTSPRVTIGAGGCRSGICVGVENGSDVFNRDANAGLRDRAVSACMAGRGYSQRSLPVCRARTATQLQSQPFDTTGLCVANGRIAAPAR
ncbi:MAG: hypothetical protein WBA02_01530 [Jannaschia helgolandensis]|uniref:hypothetical protein n=1 Tax=Jannaschia helgolandensis TaxID=188906 RepID=UPI003C751D1D